MSLDSYRTAIVTGASRGIGAATVRMLCEHGVEVHAVARSTADLEKLAIETGCHPVQLDIADRDAVLARLGKIEADILINNASALSPSTPSWQAAPTDIDALLDVNLRGTLNCLAAVVPGMKERRLGHIVNLGSTAGVWTIPGMPIYGMTKAALHNLSRSLRLDLHGTGIRITEIAPGRVETGVHLAMMADKEEGRRQFYEGYESLHAQDIANAILFVLSAPQRMDVSFMEIVPTDQSYGGSQFHRRGTS